MLNRVARAVIDRVLGDHPVSAFSYKGHPERSMFSIAWKKARKETRLPFVRIDDLQHTCGRGPRSAGVSFQDRQDLLGHKPGRVTTHYTMPELVSLIMAANAVCGDRSRKSPALTMLRRKNPLRLISNRAG